MLAVYNDWQKRTHFLAALAVVRIGDTRKRHDCMKVTQEAKLESSHYSKSQLDLRCWVSGQEYPPKWTSKGLWLESSQGSERKDARPKHRPPATGVRVTVVWLKGADN